MKFYVKYKDGISTTVSKTLNGRKFHFGASSDVQEMLSKYEYVVVSNTPFKDSHKATYIRHISGWDYNYYNYRGVEHIVCDRSFYVMGMKAPKILYFKGFKKARR